MGIHQIGGTASFFLSPIVAVAIANALGWRGSFLAVSAPISIFGIIFYVLLRKWGHDKEVLNNKSDDEKESKRDIQQILSLVPVIILNVCVQVFLFTTLSFIPFYVVDKYGGKEQTAAALLSIAHSAGLWSGPLGGYLSDHLGKMPIILATAMIAGPMIYLLNYVSLGWSISLILLFIGMTLYMSMPVTEAYVIGHTPKQSRSTLLGIYYFASRGGPGLFAPLMGYLIDKFRFYAAFSIYSIFMTIATIICTLVVLRNKE